jgi:hypothetical protein
VADFSIRLSFADQFQYLGRETIRFDALTRTTAEDDATFPRRRDARPDSFKA